MRHTLSIVEGMALSPKGIKFCFRLYKFKKNIQVPYIAFMIQKYTAFTLIICLLSCCEPCTPQLEIRNTTGNFYTVYYDSPSALSFGVGPRDTVNFAMDGEKKRTIKVKPFGSKLTAREETATPSCDETHVILLE